MGGTFPSATPAPFPTGNDIVLVSCTDPTELNCPCVGLGLFGIDTDIEGLGERAMAGADGGDGVRTTCCTASVAVRRVEDVEGDRAPKEKRSVTGSSIFASFSSSSLTSSISSGSGGGSGLGAATETAVVLVAVDGVPGLPVIDICRARGEAGV